MSTKHNTDNGFTLIEIMIAMVIFAIVSVSLLRAMTSADKIKSRGTSVMDASMLARNEAEQIKNISTLQGDLNDTLYEATCNKKVFVIERKIKTPFNMDPFVDEQPAIKEIEIVISEKNQSSHSWHYKMLQGYIN